MAIAAAAAIVSVGVGVYKTLHAAHKEKQAREQASNLKLPFYKIQDEYYQNRNLAGNLAQGGFTQGAKDLYTNEAERGYGTGVQGILDAGGSANDIAKLNDSFNRSLFNVSAADAHEQIKNIQYFMKENSDLADQKTIQFLVDQKQPYENLLSQLNQTQMAEQQNVNQGLSDTVGSLSAFGTAISNNNLYGKGKTPSRSSDNFRPDPYGGATAPINQPLDRSYLSERSIPAFNNPTNTGNAFRTAETGNDPSDFFKTLDDSDKYKYMQLLLNN